MKWLSLLLLTGTMFGQAVTGASVTGAIVQKTTSAQPLMVVTTGLPPGVQGSAYSQTLVAAGGSPAYSWSIFAPTHSITLTWTASAAASITSYRVYRSTVAGGSYSFLGATAPGILTFTDNTVVNGTTYFYVVTVVAGGVESGNSQEVTGTVPTTPQPPPGIGLSTAGVISGTPTTLGNYNFTVKVTDTVAATATQPLSIQITPNSSVADNRYCNANGTWIGPTTDGVATLPTNCINTALANTPSSGAVFTVCPASAAVCDYTTIQAAINAVPATVPCGSTISIRATDDGTSSGAQLQYTEAVSISGKVCDNTHWITVQSSLTNLLPAEGNRIYPCWAGYPNPMFGRPGPAFACPTTTGVYMPRIRTVSTHITPPCSPTVPSCYQTVTAAPLSVVAGSAYWRFIGLELVQQNGPIQIGGSVVNASNSDHVIFDRNVIHGGENPNGQSIENYCKGILAESKYTGIVDNYIYDIHSVWPAGVPNHIGCADAQAVFMGGSNDDPTLGVIKVVNNFLESSSEPFFNGGGAATVVPADFEIRRNHTFHPMFWKTDCTPTRDECQGYTWFGTQFGIKNLGEFKNGSRLILEGNIFEQSWQGDSDQNGIGLEISAKNPSQTCNVCTVNNMTIRYNLFRGMNLMLDDTAAISSQTPPGVPASQFNHSIHDNLGDDIGSPRWSSKGDAACCNFGQGFRTGGVIGANQHDTTFDHNTVVNMLDAGFDKVANYSGFIITSPLSGAGYFNVTYTNNIVAGMAKGTGALCNNGADAPAGQNMNDCFTNTWCMDGNVSATDTYPSQKGNTPYPGTTPYNAADPSSGSPHCSRPLKGNQAPLNFGAVGFVNFNGGRGGDYRLCTGVGVPAATCLAASPYINSANDGRPPGADLSLVNSNTAGVQ